jgi:hypothetical protein
MGRLLPTTAHCTPAQGHVVAQMVVNLSRQRRDLDKNFVGFTKVKVTLRELSSSTADPKVCTTVRTNQRFISSRVTLAVDGVINTTLSKELFYTCISNDLTHKNKVANSSSLIREIESDK